MGVTSLIGCISRRNRWIEKIFLLAGVNSGKLKVDSMVLGWVWSKMVVTFSSWDLKSAVS